MTRIQTRTLTADTAQRTAVTGALTAGVLALGLMVANPAAAQNYRYDRYPDRDRSSSGEDVLLGAAVGAVAGAIIGNGDGEYILGGAVAGAAIGATSTAAAPATDATCWRRWLRKPRTAPMPTLTAAAPKTPVLVSSTCSNSNSGATPEATSMEARCAGAPGTT